MVTWSPKSAEYNQSKTTPMRDVVHAFWQLQDTLNLYKCSISVITETQFANSSYVASKLYAPERLHSDATMIRSFRKRYFHVSLRGRMPISGRISVTHAKEARWRHCWINFLVRFSFLPNCRVKYYNYIVKLCSDIACNWCVSPTIGLILALIDNTTHASSYQH